MTPVPALSPRRTDKTLQLIGLLSFAALVACVSPDLITLPTPSKERFSEIKKSVADLRGLAAKHDFGIESLSVDKLPLAPSADDAGTVDSMPIAQLEHAYKQLGLLNASDDFKIALEKFHRLEHLIYYDSATDRLLITADAATMGAQLAAPYDSRRSGATDHCGRSSTRCKSSTSSGKKKSTEPLLKTPG